MKVLIRKDNRNIVAYKPDTLELYNPDASIYEEVSELPDLDTDSNGCLVWPHEDGCSSCRLTLENEIIVTPGL